VRPGQEADCQRMSFLLERLVLQQATMLAIWLRCFISHCCAYLLFCLQPRRSPTSLAAAPPPVSETRQIEGVVKTSTRHGEFREGRAVQEERALSVKHQRSQEGEREGKATPSRTMSGWPATLRRCSELVLITPHLADLIACTTAFPCPSRCSRHKQMELSNVVASPLRFAAFCFFLHSA
jgi:hypothetical protein